MIDRSASRPSSFTFTGTPITGFVVREATTPGRAAERPAIAMNTSESDVVTISLTFSGLRWADATWVSKGAPNSVRTASAFSAIFLSDSEPIIIVIMVQSMWGRFNKSFERQIRVTELFLYLGNHKQIKR